MNNKVAGVCYVLRPCSFLGIQALAGSFYHLWLAERALLTVYAKCEITAEIKAAFAAGSVGPDIGFFPGGPSAFSHRVHLHRCGEFLRELYQRVDGEVEKAFVAGWALHVYTDMAVHPWVEERVDKMLSSGIKPAIPDLWHMRLEWGIDCRLLAMEGMQALWKAELCFPQRKDGSSLLGDVGADFYTGDAEEDLLAAGALATGRWLSRIPNIMWWCGHTARQGRSPSLWRKLVFGCLGRRLVGDGLQYWPYFKDAAALASPLLPTEEVLNHVLALGEEVIEDFCQGCEQGFTQLANIDLYRGEVGDAGK